MPKIFEKLAALIPLFQIVLVILLFYDAIYSEHPFSFLGIIFVLYFFPLLLYRLFQLVYPIKEGTQYIGIREKNGHPWIVSYYCQFLLNTFSFLEKVLICIPGLYSLWLRGWGSQVGKNIVWTPSIMIVDRTHLIIEDFAFIGSLVFISNHTIRRKNGKLLLFFKKVKIGSKAMLGYGAIVGPGAEIPELFEVRALSHCFQKKIQGGVEWKS